MHQMQKDEEVSIMKSINILMSGKKSQRSSIQGFTRIKGKNHNFAYKSKSKLSVAMDRICAVLSHYRPLDLTYVRQVMEKELKPLVNDLESTVKEMKIAAVELQASKDLLGKIAKELEKQGRIHDWSIYGSTKENKNKKT